MALFVSKREVILKFRLNKFAKNFLKSETAVLDILIWRTASHFLLSNKSAAVDIFLECLRDFFWCIFASSDC